MKNKLPWRVEVEEGRRKFDENTGEPLPVVSLYWVRDANNRPIAVFGESSDREHAYLLAAAPEAVEVVKLLHAFACNVVASSRSGPLRDEAEFMIRECDAWLSKATDQGRQGPDQKEE